MSTDTDLFRFDSMKIIVCMDRYFPVIDVDKFYVDNEKQLTEKAVVKCYRRNIK